MPRPFTVTLLAIGVLTLAMGGIVRAWEAIQLVDFLTSLNISSNYLLVTGLLAGLLGLPVIWGLWLGRSWAPRLCMGYLLAVFTFYWFDRLFLTKSLMGKVNFPFAIGVTVLILLYAYWALFWKKTQPYFNQSLRRGT